jgi:catechol 2,3-dioxygenase-like lactoylglutathione lyase family enzyme
MTMRTPQNAPDQLGYVVKDLDAAIAMWRRTMDLGPWLVFRNARMDGEYRGQPTTVTMHVALAYLGETQLELIQQTNDAPSPYRTDAGVPLLGAHHIAWVTETLNADVERALANGLRLAFRAGNATTEVAYLEDPDQPGVLIERIQGAGMRQLIQDGIEAARRWDGRTAVTEIEMG